MMAAAERDPGERCRVLLAALVVAARVEARRVAEELRNTVRNGGRDGDELPGRNRHALDGEVLQHAPHQDDERWMQPEHLLQNRLEHRHLAEGLVREAAV